MPKCSNCGRELPEGAPFCPACGVAAGGFGVAQSDLSPSHFNAEMTSTSPPQTTVSADDSGFAVPAPPPPPEESAGRSSRGRRRLLLATIAILAVILVATTFESGVLGPAVGSSPAVNTASTPLTGRQLYTAYRANLSAADASYTNKTVYIQDSLDFGVYMDSSSGRYFSSVNLGRVILVWSAQTQVGQLYPGATVLAKCSVEGASVSAAGGYLLYLQGCDLVRMQYQTATSSTVSIPVTSL